MQAIAAAMGYQHEPATIAELTCALARTGEEPWWIYAYTTMFESIAQGRWSEVTPDLGRLLGKAPRALADLIG
jgi:NAD(P)H dehydrogenase (quinone)